MHLTHPIAPYQGIAPEDCFFVTNDQMIEMGMGSVTLFYQPEMYPEAPLHIYMQLDSQPAGRNLLFGALLARAEQLRAQAPNLRGRLFTQIAPEDWDLNGFYTKAGFKMDDSEDLYHFGLPGWPARAPVNCNYASVPLKTPQDVQAFLQRMNAYRIAPLDAEFLGRCMSMEHFLAIGYYRGGNAVCEALFTGEGQNVTLVSLYVRADYRRQLCQGHHRRSQRHPAPARGNADFHPHLQPQCGAGGPDARGGGQENPLGGAASGHYHLIKRSDTHENRFALRHEVGV